MFEPPAIFREDSPWEEYTDSQGKKYWHHKITKRAQWDKPDELKTDAEREADGNPWKEHLNDGKKFYHNSKTNQSVWEMPEEYRLYLERVNAAKDPKDVFKQLLLDKGMTVTWTFEQVISETKDDERSKVIKIADRKQVFQDLQNELRRREVEEKRRKQEQLFRAFAELMDTHPGIDEYSSFREATDLAGKDQRWINVPERERRQMWDDYLDDRAKRKKENEKSTRKERMDALMKELENEPRLDVTYAWRQFTREYAESPNFKALAPLDRLQVFQDFIGPLEDAVEKRFKDQKQILSAQSRKARDVFRDVLRRRWAGGEINIATKWADFAQRVKEEAGYKLLAAAAGTTPAELFYDFVDDLERKFREDKRRVKSMMRSLNLKMTSGLAFEPWLTILKQHADFAIIDQSSIQKMFAELQERASRSEEKRRRRYAPAFLDAVKASGVSRESRWEVVRGSIVEQLKKTLGDDASHLTEGDMTLLFNEFKSSTPDSDEEEGMIREDPKDRQRRGRSRSSSRSASESRSKSRSRSRSGSPAPRRSSERSAERASDRYSSSRGKRKRDDRHRDGGDREPGPESRNPKRSKPSDTAHARADVEEGEVVD